VVERNARLRERIALFEIGPVFLASGRPSCPTKPLKLVIALTGPRACPAGSRRTPPMDFYDLKGVVEAVGRAAPDKRALRARRAPPPSTPASAPVF
jgi:phenylalanyl-tRNA synthetase beta chain